MQKKESEMQGTRGMFEMNGVGGVRGNVHNR